MLFQKIITKFYPSDDNLRRLLLHHSRQVADRALSIAERHPELGADPIFLENAAMLHDVGIFLTDAPGIYCTGSEPYLLHGRLGAELMRRESEKVLLQTRDALVQFDPTDELYDLKRLSTVSTFERIASVCERHTGTGLTAENIREQHLPLPECDFLPQTLEEQIICYADKFYSKSHPERERTVEQTAQSLEKFGHEGVEKFLRWAEMFE